MCSPHAQRSWLNTSAPKNMRLTFAPVGRFQLEISMLNESTLLNIPPISLREATFHPDMSPLNALACLDIPLIVETKEVSQDEMSLLNSRMDAKRSFISDFGYLVYTPGINRVSVRLSSIATSIAGTAFAHIGVDGGHNSILSTNS